MEIKDEREKMEREARRVAVAFGIEMFKLVEDEGGNRTCQGDLGSASVWWSEVMNAETVALDYISIGDGTEDSMLLSSWIVGQDINWNFRPQPQFHDLMARGLYRLGFEDKGILSQLPELSAHAKLERRLSMPREFWPQKWLDTH